MISRHFIWKLIIWRLSSEKAIIPPNSLDLCIKGEVFVKFLFLGSTSFQIRKKYQKLFSEKLRSHNLKISYHLFKAFFHSQGKVTLNVTFKTCLLVYKHKCGGSNDTEREFKDWLWEHLGISYLPGKNWWRFTSTSQQRFKNTWFVATTLKIFNFEKGKCWL